MHHGAVLLFPFPFHSPVRATCLKVQAGGMTFFFNSVPYSFDNIFVNFSTKRTKLRTLFASFSIYNFHRRKFYVKVFVLLKRGKLRVTYHLAMIRSINESL